MQDLTMEEFKKEMETFEQLCNKAQDDLQSYIDGCEDLQLKDKLQLRYEQFQNLVKYVTEETNFINAPASTKFHLCIKHGLLKHSNSVTRTLLRLNKGLNCGIPIYKLITVGLFHDLGKHDDYIEKEPTEKQKAAGYKATPPYLFNTSGQYNEHESQSVYLLSKYIDLGEDEQVAILYHNSPWDGNIKCAFRKCLIMTLLQNADYFSTVYLEDREE